MGLKDKIIRFFERPEVEAGKPPATGEIGWDDTVLYSSRDFPKYNPDALISKKGHGIYRKMMLDDQVKACMQFKQHAVVSRGYYFDVAADDDGQPRADHREMADYFEHAIKAIRGSFTDHLIGILSALQNGFSITEKIYAPVTWQDKAMWGIMDLKLRPFDSFHGGFKVDVHGNINELKQAQGGNSVPIPYDKVIHFVHQPDIDRHYGESDLRACYRNWWSKDIAIKFQNVFLERLASGFIWAQVKGHLTDKQKTDLQNLIKNISSKMGAILPENVELNSFNPHQTFAHERTVAQHDKAISKSILVPNLLGLSEQGQHGSYSQSDTQLKAFFWILDAIANRLAEALNEQTFRSLALWNFSSVDYPRFRFEPISDEQKIEIARGWKELVVGGAVTRSDADEAWIRRLVGAPEKSEDGGQAPGVGDQEPGGEAAMPDNEDWIAAQGERAELIRKECAQKPWLRRVDFARTAQALDDHDVKLLDEINDLMAAVRTGVEKQIVKIVGQRSMGNVTPKEIEAVKVPAGLVSVLRKTIRTNLQAVLNDGYDLAKKELPKKTHQSIRPGMDKTQAERFLSSKAMKIAGGIEQDVVKAVQRVLENGIKYDKTLKETIDSIGTDTDLLRLLPETDAAGRPINIPQRLENIARTNTADALNQARTALFGDPELKGFVLAYEYSAVLDSRVTEICEHLNGKILKDFGEYTPPNHYMCRSLLVPVTIVDNWDGKESPPPRMRPHKGFA